jgi:hypothetical protein
METMHAARRRTLPPVPRASTEQAADEPVTERFELALPEQADHRRGRPAVPPVDDEDPPTERFVVDLPGEGPGRAPDDLGPATERFVPDLSDDEDEDDEPVAEDADTPPVDVADADPAQQFVARMRSAADDFAEAAGAASAVVREAVPPARHRRARCRVVLRYADDAVTDVTFLGPTGIPGTPSRHGFDRQIRRWFGAGQRRDDAWVVADPEAPDGLAVDVTAWLAAG